MSFEQPIVPADVEKIRLRATGALLFAVIAMAFVFQRFLAEGYGAVQFGWQLDYGEGIVWEQMRLMVAGRGYGAIDGLPAIVFHYPPLFHMVTAALAGVTGLDALAVGRSVSIGSTLLIGLFAGLIAAKVVRAEDPSRPPAVCGLVAGLSVFCFAPVLFWAPLMRVDMLSIALSFAGLFVAMSALARPKLIAVSAILFVAAVFTKQTSVVAPAAVFLTFLLLRPRLAWILAGSCTAIGLAVLGALVLATDGGFVRHIVLYNANRIDWSRLSSIPAEMSSHSFFIAVVVICVATRLKARLPLYRRTGSFAAVRQRLDAAPGDGFFLLVLVYASLTSLMTLAIAKSGSSVNYFIEWTAVLAILLGIAARDAANAAFGKAQAPGKRPFPMSILLPVLIGFQALVMAPPASYAELRSAARIAAFEELQAMIRSADRPVISDDMVLLVRSGTAVQWEPAIFAELASTGTWNETPFVGRIRAGQFAFFITDGTRGTRPFDSRYNPAVADAIDAAYPVKRTVAGYTLHLPAGSTP